MHFIRFQRQNMHVSWKRMSPQGNEWNPLYLKNTKTTLQAKDILRWPITIWFTNLLLCHKRWKFSHAQAAVEKELKKLETIPARQLEKVKSEKKRILEAQRDKRKGHFATLMDICHLKNAELEPTLQKSKGRVVLRSRCSLYWTGLVCVPNDCRKSNGWYCKITRLRRTSSWCSIRVHSGKTGGRSQIAQNSEIGMSRRVDTSSTTSMAKLIGWHCIQWFLLNEMCTVTHLQASCGKDSLKKLYWNLDWKKYRIGNVFLFIENKDYSHRSLWMTFWMAGKKQNTAPRWNKMMENVDLDEPTSFLDHGNFWMYSTWMQIEWNHYWSIYKDVWVTYFCWSNWKVTMLGKNSRKNSRVVLRHGRTCSKMRWEILRAGKKSGAVFQSNMFTWHSYWIGTYPTCPNGIIDPLKGSPKRLSYGVFPSHKRSWMFRR